MTKPIENYEQLIQRFTKRTMQLSSRNQELLPARAPVSEFFAYEEKDETSEIKNLTLLIVLFTFD